MAVVKEFDCYIAVDYGGLAIIVDFPEELRGTLDGGICSDNAFYNEPTEPGVYKCHTEFRFEQGYCDGFPADGENTWEYTVVKYEKVDLR